MHTTSSQPQAGREAYRDALAYLYSLTNYEQRGFAAYAPEFYNLERMERLLALLGNPERSYRIVHVAGTKGKGSTSAMIASILSAAGYRTGLYTSPHLHTFRERIQAGGQMISAEDVVRLVGHVRPLAAQVEGITTFEVMTGVALAWYAEQEVDWVVLEVGLGGRLDATNVVTPQVAVITSISLDHVAILGDTLAQIAAEKAGIVKPGVPVVSAPQYPEALALIRATCAERGAPLTLVGDAWTWGFGPADLEGQSFTLLGPGEALDELWIPLLGDYQVVNAATAVAAVRQIDDSVRRVPGAAIRAGLRALHWPGRFEILSRAPLLVVDSAHNGDSARKLVAALRAHLDYTRLIVILGASADHATPDLLTALLAPADRAFATRSRHARAASPAWLQERAAELGLALEVTESVEEALARARHDAAPSDLVCCTGSVFVAAEARAAWFARQGLEGPEVDPL
ncbi:MAG: bifunctional folylpolyglutamate synthase/dihydrofolate synthase [Anaerolineae bacterium]|nr:bifunctional folylpolyglutamate synthase/dihydrofolate synthase [Anaerolineae bacterium]